MQAMNEFAVIAHTAFAGKDVIRRGVRTPIGAGFFAPM